MSARQMWSLFAAIVVMCCSGPAAATSLNAAVHQQLQESHDGIETLIADIADIERQLDELDGILREILVRRRDQLLARQLTATNSFSNELLELRDDGSDVDSYIVALTPIIADVAPTAIRQIDRINDGSIFPLGDMDMMERVRLDRLFFEKVARVDEYYKAAIDNIRISRELSIETDDVAGSLRSKLELAAIYRSVFLSLAIEDLATWRESSTILGKDDEAAARVRLATVRVEDAAHALQTTVDLLASIDVEVRRYRQQILAATGEITADLLDRTTIKEIFFGAIGRVGQVARENGARIFFRLLLVVAIIGAAVKIGGWLRSLTLRIMESSRVSVSSLLGRMITAIVKNLVILFGVLIALSQLGVSLGPLLAGLGIAGFIVGFAMQDTLSNFASGVMILVYRPFDMGDEVEAGGVSGIVGGMSLVNTTFITMDNQSLVVPNNVIWQSVIRNVTSQQDRRIDLVIGVSYDDDPDEVERVLREILRNNKFVLETPEPNVQLNNFAESSVEFVVRPWVRTADYRPAYWSILRSIKSTFDEHGISFPFPQRDVHLYNRQKVAESVSAS